MLDHHGNLLEEDNTTLCTITVQNAPTSPTSTPVALIAPKEAVMLRGVATFPDLAVHARSGEQVRFTAKCERKVLDNVEDIPVITHNATIRTLAIDTETEPAGRSFTAASSKTWSACTSAA